MHFQYPPKAEIKLVKCLRGSVLDVIIDLRNASATLLNWHGELLSAENQKMMYIPEGFAHGFCVLSDTADVIYKCTDYYSPEGECGIFWADPAIGIDWPVKNPILSKKDNRNPKLSGLAEERLPIF